MICRYARSGGEFVEQHWYNCNTCGLIGDKGCCAVCVRVCHSGHDVAYSRRSSFFCDCGAESRITDSVESATREILSKATSARRAAALLASAGPCRCLASGTGVLLGATNPSSAVFRKKKKQSNKGLHSTQRETGEEKAPDGWNRTLHTCQTQSLSDGFDANCERNLEVGEAGSRDAFLYSVTYMVSAVAFRYARKTMMMSGLASGTRDGLEAICNASLLLPHLETVLVSLGIRAEQTVTDRLYCPQTSLSDINGTEGQNATPHETEATFKSSQYENAKHIGTSKAVSIVTTNARSQRSDQMQVTTAVAGALIRVRAATKAGSFEVRSPGDLGSTPVARQLRALSVRHRVTPRLLTSDSQGRVAIAERRQILLCALSNAFLSFVRKKDKLNPEQQRPNASDGRRRDSTKRQEPVARSLICVLARLTANFDVVAIEFNPVADQHLAAWGLRDVVVYALDGGERPKKTRRCRRHVENREERDTRNVNKCEDREEYEPQLRGDAIVRVELSGLSSVAGGEAAYIVTCKWVPGRSTVLAVATTINIRIYDLAIDTAIPRNVFVLAYDQHRIRDATIAPGNRFMSGCSALYVILDTGRVYGAEIHETERDGSRSDIYLDLDALPIPTRLFADAGAGECMIGPCLDSPV